MYAEVKTSGSVDIQMEREIGRRLGFMQPAPRSVNGHIHMSFARLIDTFRIF